MAKSYCLIVLTISITLLLHIKSVNGQEFKLSNETAYLTEVLTHTSPNDGANFHFIGWLLNTSTFNIGTKHSFNLGVMLTHGGEPSANIVGDLQTFSNLEAGSLFGFNELFYQYKVDGFWLKLGQQDINSDFIVSENGLLFTHSSFGIDPFATLNMPAPTYPVTGFSISSGIDISNSLNLKLGIFDGQFAIPNESFLTINWDLNKQEGLLYIIEPEFKFFRGKLSQKFGIYHHSGIFTNRETQASTKGLTAFYLVSDLEVMKNGKKSANLFLQFDTSTKSVSDLNYYYGFGMSFENWVNTKKNNEIGLALGYAKLNHEFTSIANEYGIKSETVIELNYKQEFKDWLSIQPYFHWIGMNELGVDQRNPIVFALRAYIEF